MKTPKEIVASLSKPEGVCFDGMEKWVAEIQEEAFNEGHSQGMRDYQSMQGNGLNMEIVMDSINRTGLWATKETL